MNELQTADPVSVTPDILVCENGGGCTTYCTAYANVCANKDSCDIHIGCLVHW